MSREVPLTEFMGTVLPGDPHSWEDEMAWIRENHQQHLTTLTFDISSNGIQDPILIGTDLRCWDGHHRVTAAFDLGLEEIPITYAIETPEAQRELPSPHIEAGGPGVKPSIKENTMDAQTPYSEVDTVTLSESVDLLTFWYDDTHWFPFTESPNADITGPGHQDPMAFVHAIRSYDELATDEDHALLDVRYVKHRYIVVARDRETFYLVPKGTEGAFPVTTLWNVR